MPRTAKPTDNLDTVRHLMGKMPDHDIAKQVGSTPSIVGRYRRKHGIPAYEGYKFGMGQEPPSKKLTPEPVAKPAPAAETASAPGRSKLDPFRAIIGTLSDAEVASQAGVTAEAVRIYRRRHNIAPKSRNTAAKAAKAAKTTAAAPPAVEKAAPVAAKAAPTAAQTAEADKKAPLRRASKLDGFLDLVGVVPDREVATMAGVTTENVRAFRRRHDIAARWREEDEVVAAPQQAAPKATAKAAEPRAAAPVQAAPAPKAAEPRVAAPAQAAVKAAEPVKAVEPRVAAPVQAAPVQAAPVAAVAPPAAPVAAKAAAVNGYSVHVKTGDQVHEYLIVATDIAAAANNAVRAVSSRHSNAEITSIRHLGPALA